jgi:hypothetical protein
LVFAAAPFKKMEMGLTAKTRRRSEALARQGAKIANQDIDPFSLPQAFRSRKRECRFLQRERKSCGTFWHGKTARFIGKFEISTGGQTRFMVNERQFFCLFSFTMGGSGGSTTCIHLRSSAVASLPPSRCYGATRWRRRRGRFAGFEDDDDDENDSPFPALV